MAEPTPDKIEIMKGAESDLSAATFRIFDESHTMGNALRWMIMKNPNVEFCGYSVPHPSENFIQLRIQMYDGLSALATLEKALHDLDALYATVEDSYKASLMNDTYERFEEKA